MSKPTPGLGKGLVRTLAQHPSPSSTSLSSQLTPIVSQHGHSTSYVIAGPSKSVPITSLTPPFTLPVVQPNALASSSSSSSLPLIGYRPLSTTSTPSYLSLIPSWDSPNLATFFSSDAVTSVNRFTSDAISVVLPYRTPSSTISARLTAPIAIQAFGHHRHTHTQSHTRITHHGSRKGSVSYTTSSTPVRAMAIDPGSISYQMFNSTFLGPIPYGPSLPPSLLNVDKGSIYSIPALYQNTTSNFDSPLSDSYLPPPPPPPSPGPSHPAPQSMRPSRSSESHTVLSPTPPTPTSNSNPSPNLSLSSLPYLAFDTEQNPILPPGETTTEGTTLNLYSSSLIFHLGASGSAKDRLNPPPSPRRFGREPPPPRPRSFPLPDITAPTNFRSTPVGEDAYFTRFDGMCVADGVGGWAKSGRGGADAGRWSRLLTHFCEIEVGNWWAGAESYVIEVEGDRRTRNRDERIIGESISSNIQEGAGVTEWARRAWRKSSSNSAKISDDSEGLESGKRRRPLDPVEVMQKGFEKCLACVMAEGIHGSSTCLLALLHHSTLLIANLGDCSLLLIRRGEVIFRTTEMQHAFNFPMQLGTHSKDEPMKDAKRYDVVVERGDVVVVGSDGLMDNLFEHEILETLAQFEQPSSTPQTSQSFLNPSSHLPTPPSSRPTSPSALPPFSPQKVSEALCKRARNVSEQTQATTPFMERAIEQGIDFVGGKKDDISVLVGVIGDREPSTSLADLGLQHI